MKIITQKLMLAVWLTNGLNEIIGFIKGLGHAVVIPWTAWAIAFSMSNSKDVAFVAALMMWMISLTGYIHFDKTGSLRSTKYFMFFLGVQTMVVLIVTLASQIHMEGGFYVL